MNTDNELERMLGRELHDQVDGMTGVPFGFDDVKGRAGRIRRNRRIAAGVGVAAALAVIVPTAITAGGVFDSKREIDPARPSPDAPVEVSRTTLTLDGLERGDAPAIEYFTPDGVVLPGEGLQELDQSYQAMVRSEADGGWIAYGPARDEIVYLTEDFEPQNGSAANDGLATTSDREYVAWTMPEAGAQTLGVHSTTNPDEGTFWDFGEFPVVLPVGILGPDSVVYETVTAKGESAVGLANPDGSTTDLPYLGASGADPVNGRISVQTDVRRSTGCFAMVDVATLDELWDTCAYRLGAFSPDGEYVMATNADADGLGLSEVDVLDADTGDLVARFSQSGDSQIFMIGSAWESSDSIVAVAVEGETQTMVRMGVDGTLEEVADPVQGDPFGDLYYYVGADRARL